MGRSRPDLNLTHALAKSLLLFLITCSLPTVYASAPSPQCPSDYSGYFYAAGKLPQPFEEFDHLTLWERHDDDEQLPGQGLYTTLGRAYRFDAIKRSGVTFEFTTDTVNGVSYSFTGQFKYPCIFEEFYALDRKPGAIAAEGKLLKLSDGKTVA